MIVSKCWNVAVASSCWCKRFCRSILSRKNAFQLVVISPTVNGRQVLALALAWLLAAIAKRGWYLLAYLPCDHIIAARRRNESARDEENRDTKYNQKKRKRKKEEAEGALEWKAPGVLDVLLCQGYGRRCSSTTLTAVIMRTFITGCQTLVEKVNKRRRKSKEVREQRK